MAEILHVGKANFEKEVLKSKTPVLVDFYAIWCGPCHDFAPVLEQLAAETSKLKVAKVDIEKEPELAIKYGIRHVPTICIFKNGEIVADDSGYKPIEVLREFVKPHI